MPQSIFAANGTQFLDGVDTDYAPAQYWNLGVQYIGGSKGFLRRCLGTLDVFGVAAAGRALTPSDTLAAAELVLQTLAVIGPSGWGAKVERIARADWDYTVADWTRYKVGALWTTAGGDVGTPPAAVAFSAPAVAGEQVIGGLLAYVADAIASRGGKVLLRLKADDEAPAQTQWVAYEANLSAALRPRLRVTYVSAEPAPIDEPREVSLLGVRPARGDPAARAAGAESPARPSAVKDKGCVHALTGRG